MDNINLNYKIEWGILIYQLPKEFMAKAINILKRDIKYTFFDEKGLRVYFSRKETCDDFIRRKYIDLEGILFYIFSTVTCLTVIGIHPFASKETIQTYLQGKDMRVYDLYQIVDTNNYRIILEVPEILANIELNPILLDANYGIFPMEFYCRVCRREGHKQYQCQQSLAEKEVENDTGSGFTEACSKNERSSKQGNFARTTGSRVSNTRGRSEDIQSASNLSTRENNDLTVATPSTSTTPTPAEKTTRRYRNLTTRKNKDVRGRTRYSRSAKNATTRTLRNKYPGREIIKSIMDTKGILSPKKLLEFVELVYKKKKAIKYAKQYAQDINALIKQIRSVISHYNQRNSNNSIANRDIKMLEDLCKRLDS